MSSMRATAPVGSSHSLWCSAGSSRRSTWSVVQETVATVGMPSFWKIAARRGS